MEKDESRVNLGDNCQFSDFSAERRGGKLENILEGTGIPK